jgi:outer membrane immunogenic protein
MKTIGIAAVALAFTGSAYAADMPIYVKAPPVAAPSWTGLYIGVNGGGAWGQTETQLSAANNAPAFFNPVNIPTVQAAGSNNVGNSGGLGGGQIGYLIQSGSIVAGFEAAFDWMRAKGSFSNTAVYPGNAPATFTDSGKVSSDWLFTFLGRIGVDMGSWYPYVTGGLAVADLKYTNTFTDTTFAAGCACVASINSVVPGLAGGAGLEWRFDSHWSLRGEYLYILFSGVNGTSTVVSGPGVGFGTATLTHQASFSENIARAALSYKF